MKIVAAHPGPAFSVHDVHVGWCEALRKLGHQVAEYNLSERLTFYDAAMIELPNKEMRKALNHDQAYELAVNGLYATLYKLQPDMLLVTSSFFYYAGMLEEIRSRGIKVVLIHTESPYEDDRQVKLSGHVDVNIVNDPTNLDRFRQENPKSYYMPHSYRPGFHEPGPSNAHTAADFVFVGTGYRSRIDFLERMDFGDLDVLLAGNWQLLKDESPLRKYVAHDINECIDNEQTVDVYRGSKIGLNLYRKEGETAESISGWSCGPREIEMAACGMFYMRESRGESDELFPMLPTVSSPDEATLTLNYYINRQDLRDDATLEARIAIQDRTFVNRAKELMRLMN